MIPATLYFWTLATVFSHSLMLKPIRFARNVQLYIATNFSLDLPREINYSVSFIKSLIMIHPTLLFVHLLIIVRMAILSNLIYTPNTQFGQYGTRLLCTLFNSFTVLWLIVTYILCGKRRDTPS